MKTTSYSEKMKLDIWSKQTQNKPNFNLPLLCKQCFDEGIRLCRWVFRRGQPPKAGIDRTIKEELELPLEKVLLNQRLYAALVGSAICGNCINNI